MDKSDDIYKEKLKELRNSIDKLDRDILKTLVERNKVVDKVGELKKEAGLPVFQKERWFELFDKIRKDGTSMGLSVELLDTIYTAIHDDSVRRQKDITSE